MLVELVRRLTASVVIFYLEGIVHLLLGNNTAHVIVTAQANQCALALRLNEESVGNVTSTNDAS